MVSASEGAVVTRKRPLTVPLPCPQCGIMPEMSVVFYWVGKDECKRHQYRCTRCGVEAPSCHGQWRARQVWNDLAMGVSSPSP